MEQFMLLTSIVMLSTKKLWYWASIPCFFSSFTTLESCFSFDGFMDFIFTHSNIYEVLDIIGQIPAPTTKRSLNNKSRISEYYISMYQQFEGFIELGRKEGYIKEHLPTAVLLGMIFQIIAIPNHFNIPEDEWIASIKEILRVRKQKKYFLKDLKNLWVMPFHVTER